MNGHSIISPSALARTIQCPGSVVLEQQYPEAEKGPEAAEGEASHWAGAEMLSGRLVDVGDRAPNSVLLTQEMVEGADLYYDDVVRTLRGYGLTPADGAIEVPVSIPRVHAECWGTPDFRAWIPGDRRNGRPLLMVWDYKFGHRHVPVFENPQLSAYAAGCLSAADISDLGVDVEMRIVQPRSYSPEGSVRRWACPASALRALVNIASNSAHQALGGDPPTRVGPECRDCRARHACPTLQRAAATACDEAGKVQPFNLPPAALGVELRWLTRARDLLDARISGLQEQATAAIKRGQQVPHWRIERGAGRRRWSRGVGEVLAMGQALGLNLAKPPEAITPTQAVAAGLPEMLLDAYTDPPRGAATLVPDDGSQAKRVFGARA